MKRPILTLFLAAFSLLSYAQIEDIQGDMQLYHFDNTPDCESEGFIRFTNRSSDRVGILNNDGEIAIPAEYSDLTRVHNGLIYALKGATKKFSDDGEHYHWEGGEVLLIDINNRIMAKNLTNDYNLNLFSLVISDLPSTDPIRSNIEAVNGQYYSFIDFDREFKNWLYTEVLANFSKETLLQKTHPKITYWSEDEGWVSENQISFIERNFEHI